MEISMLQLTDIYQFQFRQIILINLF